ncbi:MAG TPA: DUF2905 domain-containing protein [Burkholderiales bacterium]|nr:DUF2905 domain-containing protein [Burkholderiales bacterium]
MLKWFVAFSIALALIGWLNPVLRKIGLGRLPGDLSFVVKGREYNFPFASSLLLSAVCTWLVYAIS